MTFLKNNLLEIYDALQKFADSSTVCLAVSGDNFISVCPATNNLVRYFVSN
jgi:hypothetical protein